jgi:hypothetical protein
MAVYTRDVLFGDVLFRGRIMAVTGGYIGDAPPYQGHVSILDAATGAIQATWNSLCSDRPGLLGPADCPQAQSAIWSRGGAVIDPATGNIFITTGNGPWDGRTAWGDSLIELDPDRDAHARELDAGQQ